MVKKKTDAHDQGMQIKAPAKSCHDRNCPFHGDIKVHGRIFTGVVISDKMQRTATVEWGWKKLVKKYERYEPRRSRVKAHNPDCLNVQNGDVVRLGETRPLSKTKSFVILEKISKVIAITPEDEAKAEAKTQKPQEKTESEKAPEPAQKKESKAASAETKPVKAKKAAKEDK
jgi:small subunit ribosomal protein S17